MKTTGSGRFTAEGVFKSYSGKRALQNAVITVEPHSITGLLGCNGAGKSTLMQILFGSLAADEGIFRWNGQSIRKPLAVAGLVNYLPQRYFLPAGMSTAKAISTFGLEPSALCIDFPELEDTLRCRIGLLSGGTRRLIEAWIILQADVRFSLLDEPFSHIAPLYVTHLQELIQQKRGSKGILLSDHLYRPLLAISDTIWFLQHGSSTLIRDSAELVRLGYLPAG